jgi:hypothetical protein
MMTEAPVRIEDKGMARAVEIKGRRVGYGTSQRLDSLAWAEIEIYKLDGGGYQTHRVGRSLTYHRSDTQCVTASGRQRGSEATVDDLPDDAEPCAVCKPRYPTELGDSEAIRFEFPRHTFDGCPDADDVVEKLTVIHNRDHTTSVRFSQPVQAALHEAVLNDEDFRPTGMQ